jgi:hypothetical protein
MAFPTAGGRQVKPFVEPFPTLIPFSAPATTGLHGGISPLFLLGRINSFCRLVSIVADEPMAQEVINKHENFTHIYGHENV